MADGRISQDPAASALAGTEKIPVVQGAANKYATPAQIAAYLSAGGYQVSATSRVLGRITAGAGNVEELTGSQLRTIASLATTDAPTFAGLTVTGQSTFPGGANTARSFGTDSAWQLLNAASTQNWYAGIKDSDANKLWIGRGYGPAQNITPAIKIDTTDNVAFLAAITAPGAMLTAAATLKMGSNVYCLELQQDNATDGYRVKVNSGGGHLEFYRRAGGTDALVYWWDTTNSAFRTVGDLRPNVDNTYAAGTAALRWANVYGTTLQHSVFTVATLPAGSAGMRTSVTDANATTFLTTVAAGGANKVPVVHDGTSWKIG